jgi:haloalkane dehalogenase
VLRLINDRSTISRRTVLAAAGASALYLLAPRAAFGGSNVPTALRTPDARFANLPNFSYPPNYVDSLPGYEGLRAHYLDLGPRDATRTFLCLHGEPTWCFLYRKMIPVMLKSGARVVAPDLYGFGRSDKPKKRTDYSFDFERNYLLRFVKHLDLRNITLVVQDWGGMLGLTLPVDGDFRQRLSRLIVMNTVIPVGEPLAKPFYSWRAFARDVTDFEVGKFIKSLVPQLTAAEAAGYDAPFPDETYKSAVHIFPSLVMVEPGMQGVATAKEAMRFWSSSWDGLTFMAIGELDSALGLPTMIPLSKTIRGCPPPMLLKHAGHFVQEWGEPVAYAALRSFGDLPKA